VSVRVHVPAGWDVTGELPALSGDPPLHISDPAGSFELDVEWCGDAFVGAARIGTAESLIRAASPTAIREWALGALALVQQQS
jgi:hypothetical protein